MARKKKLELVETEVPETGTSDEEYMRIFARNKKAVILDEAMGEKFLEAFGDKLKRVRIRNIANGSKIIGQYLQIPITGIIIKSKQ